MMKNSQEVMYMDFTINNIKWNIAFVNPNDEILMRSDGSVTVGVTDRDTCCVYISNAIFGTFFEHVLCHELCHCVCMSWNIYMQLDDEEKLCNFMADHGKEIIYLLDDLLASMVRRVA